MLHLFGIYFKSFADKGTLYMYVYFQMIETRDIARSIETFFPVIKDIKAKPVDTNNH